MISYSASGNSRAILNENEEIIEFLAYDRLSENEKCELYVLYRSKKNADGSWHISEAEILDIFAYNMSTKMWLVAVKHHGQQPEMKSIMK